VEEIQILKLYIYAGCLASWVWIYVHCSSLGFDIVVGISTLPYDLQQATLALMFWQNLMSMKNCQQIFLT